MVGPYVSVIGGHPEFIENSLFTSVVQAAAWARLREILHRAYQHVRRFRGEADSPNPYPPHGYAPPPGQYPPPGQQYPPPWQ